MSDPSRGLYKLELAFLFYLSAKRIDFINILVTCLLQQSHNSVSFGSSSGEYGSLRLFCFKAMDNVLQATETVIFSNGLTGYFCLRTVIGS